MVVPSPSWPSELLPTVQTVPSTFRNMVCEPPDEISTTPLNELPLASSTWTGLLLWVVVPSPSRPEPLSPTDLTVPSSFKYIVWVSPAETSTTPVREFQNCVQPARGYYAGLWSHHQADRNHYVQRHRQSHLTSNIPYEISPLKF